MKPFKKPKYKLDPKKFEPESSQVKKEKDWETSEEIFNEIRRSKTRGR